MIDWHPIVSSPISISMDINLPIGKLLVLINQPFCGYTTRSLSRTFKGPGHLFEIEKVGDIENLTK